MKCFLKEALRQSVPFLQRPLCGGIPVSPLPMQGGETMIVNNNIQSVTTLYGSAQAAHAYRSKAAGKAAQQDEVVISEAGQSFSDMLQKLRSGDEVRQEKVDAYTQGIVNGIYHVDAKDIAAKMLGPMM